MATMTTARLSDRIVLVTGGARRLGAASGRRLHAAGARLAVHYHRSAADADRLCAELNAERPGSAAAFGADLLDVGRLDGLVAAVVDRFGGLDVLINNASSFYPTPIGETTPAQWDELMGTNVRAPFFLAQAAAPVLRARGGSIVNMVDVYAERPLAGYAPYCAAKAALVNLTRALARELAPQVRVNAVAPGAILWPEGEEANEAARARIIARTPLARLGTAEDIAAAVYYLVAEAPFVSGQVLAVDGGRAAVP